MKPVRVVFLGLYFEAWDALDEIYQIMLSDPRFEPTVISLPRKLTGQLKYADEEKAHAFFESRRIDHLRFNFGGDGSENDSGLKRLKELAPDYVFINYPWQRNYQPAIRFDNLAMFTRLVYIPYYSLPMVEEPDHEPGGGQSDSIVATHLYKQRLHQIASLVFTQDQFVKDAYRDTERGDTHVHFTGSPKIDALRKEATEGAANWPINLDQRAQLRIVWAPHHSYSPHWLNFGMFAKVRDQMLWFAQQNPDIEIVLRPHPFLWGTLVDRGVLSKGELTSWRRLWDLCPNTFVDEYGSYAELFLATDVLVTDGISFLGEYPLVTGKPAIFLENPEHWKFTKIGEVAANSSIRVQEFKELVYVLDQVRFSGLPTRDSEIDRLISVCSPNPGESAKKIVERVYEDYREADGSPPLVDLAAITETAWEFVPGREPFED